MHSTRVEDFRLEDWLPYWLSADDLIVGLATLAMFIAALAVFQALRGANPFERRYAMVAQRRESLRAVALEPRRGRQRMSTAGRGAALVGAAPKSGARVRSLGPGVRRWRWD